MSSSKYYPDFESLSDVLPSSIPPYMPSGVEIEPSGTVISSGNQVKVYSSGTLVRQGKVLTGEEIVSGANNSMFVYDGGTAKQTVISSGGSMMLYGGLADATTLSETGYIFISNGGIAHDTTVNSKGYVYVRSSGSARDTVINHNGVMYVFEGGTASDTKLNAYGYLFVSSNGQAINNQVEANGIMSVSSNGIARNTTVAVDGYLHIHSGASATGINAAENAQFEISVASNTYIQGVYADAEFEMKDAKISDYTLYASARTSVFSGAIANNITVNKDGWLVILSGGTAQNVILNSGGDATVSSGGGIHDVTVSDGGRLYVYGKESYNESNNTYEAVCASAQGVEILSGGYVNVAGGTLNDVLIQSAGDLVISGYSNDGTIDIHGHLSNCVIEYGGSVCMNEGVELYGSNIFGGTVSVESNVDADAADITFNMTGRTVDDDVIVDNLAYLFSAAGYGITVSADLAEGSYILAGNAAGFAETVTISNSTATMGSLTVGGAALTFNGMKYTLNVVDNVLTLTIADGSLEGDQVKVYSNGALIKQGTVLTGETIVSGGNNSMFVYSGGTANSTTVNSSGYMYISSGGVANSTTVNSWGDMRIYSGGVANSTTVNSWGDMRIYSGGVASNTTVNSVGFMHISSGGVANSTTVNGTGGNFGYMYISSGGVANSTTVNGGDMYISSGVANSTTVDSDGFMYIRSGGVANSTTVNSSGCMYVSSGGTANSTTVNSGGYLYVTDGNAYDTIIRAQGSARFDDDGYGSHLLISSGGNGYIGKDGFVYKTIVSSGGVLTVAGEMRSDDGLYYGGYGEGSNVTILNGGSANISGGYVWDLTVSSGGKVTLADFFDFNYTWAEGLYTEEYLKDWGYDEPEIYDFAGTIYNGEIHSGATLTAAGGCMVGKIVLGGTITLNASANASDAKIYFDISERTVSDGYILNNIAYLDDAASYSITVSASQACGTYKLAGGASSFTGTLSIGTETVDYGSITVNGEDFVYNGKTYSLDQANGNLTLSITSGGSSGPVVSGSQVQVYSSGTLVKQGNILTGEMILSGSNDSMFVYSGGIASNTTISSRGALYVSSGGLVNSTLMNAYGTIDISRGIASNTTISQGIMTVFSGGKAYATAVYGGRIYASDGGILSGNTMYNGYIYVGPSGIASNTILSGGSINLWWGSSFDTRIYSGYQSLMNGGIAIRTTFHSGTYLEGGWSWATVSSAIANSRSYITVSSNAVVKDGHIHSGAYLEIEDTRLEGVLHLGGNMRVLDVCSGSSATLNFRVDERKTTDTVMVDNIANLTAMNYCITVSAYQAYGTYQLAQGAMDFAGNISIGTTNSIFGSLTVNGASLTHGNRNYTLSNAAGALTLTIASGTSGTSGTSSSWTGNAVRVYSFGALVKQGQILTGEVLTYGGNDVMYAFSGGIASSTTVNSATSMWVKGGTAKTTLVNSSGIMTVFSGGIASDTTISGGLAKVYSNGSLKNVSIYSKGSAYISSGGSASNIYVNSGGYLYTASQGKVDSAFVSSGGWLYVYSRGTATNITASSGARLYFLVTPDTCIKGNYAGSGFVISNAYVSNYTIHSGCTIIVNSSGVADFTTAASGGYMAVSQGVANHLTVSSGGSALLSSESIITGNQIFGGKVTAQAGANASDAQIYFDISERTVSDGYILNNISYLDALSYSVTVDATQAYGTYKLAGGASSFTETLSIGTETVTYGSITVNGADLVYNGKSYSLDQANGYLTLSITSGGSSGPVVSGSQVRVYSSGTLVKQGNILTGERILSGGNNSMFVYSGGTANSTTLCSSGCLYVSSGGTANRTTVNSTDREYIMGGTDNESVIRGGVIYVYSGGTANSTTVSMGGNSSGVIIVKSGGTANHAVANSYTHIMAESGGVTNSTTINNGAYLFVLSGAVANNTVVNSGGELYLWDCNIQGYYGGTANSTLVNPYGTMTVVRSAVANSTTLWGEMQISSGTANNTIICSGGNMLVASNGTVNDTTVNKGGKFFIYGTGKHRRTLNVKAGAVVSAYAGGIIDFTVSEWSTAKGYLVNNLASIQGSPTYTITVKADQAYGTYKLAGGASSFTGTLSIGTETVNYGSITVNGTDLVHDGRTYSLDQADGNLTLTITAGGSIDPGKAVKVYSYGTLVQQADTINDALIAAAGNNSMYISNGGIANRTLVKTGGNVYVSNGGKALTTVISSGGNVSVYNGGLASMTTIHSSGGLHIYKGGVASQTTVNQSGYFGIGDGAAAYDTTIDYAGNLTVWKGGIISGNTINTYGTIILSSGALAKESLVNANGGLHVYSGAVASETIIKKDGFMGAGLGANIYKTTLDDYGKLTLWGGANAYNNDVGYAAELTVLEGGYAENNTINTWGAVILNAGATGNYTTINANGGYHIYNGATAYTTTVGKGAFLGIGLGGTVYNLNIQNGASATFYDESILRGWNDFAGTITVNEDVDAAESMIAFNITQRSTNTGNIISDISGIAGASYYLTLDSASQSSGRYYLAGNAGKIDKVTITGTPTELKLNSGLAIYGNNAIALGLDEYNNLFVDIVKISAAASPEGTDTLCNAADSHLGSWDNIAMECSGLSANDMEERKDTGFLAVI